MWKYIVIVALVLLAAGSFVFYKTHQGLVSADGEVAALQKEYEAAISKNKELFTDETISAYARIRGEWLVQCKSDAEAQEAKLHEEDVTYTTEIERLEAEFKSMGGNAAEFENEKQSVLSALANDEVLQKALSDLQESSKDIEVSDMDASDPDLLTNLANNVRLLEERRKVMVEENAKEESSIQKLQGDKDRLVEAISKQDSLTRERQARVSPENLRCNVVLAEPSWDYAIVDAGVDAGVIIGSRLAVMRNNRKICEMNVTSVENNRSSCDIIVSTLLAGETVQPGDSVVSIRPAHKD